ncbi:MAG: GspE/PulE family protein [Actinomycetota bacterium]|nr:GspE/PulE family protein [Actinomycetota bacterium]
MAQDDVAQSDVAQHVAPAESVNGNAPADVVAQPVTHAPARPGVRLLGELLVDHSLITPAQLAEALLQQSASGKRLGALLVELGALDERKLAETLAEQLGLRVVDLRQEVPQPEAIALVPESLARSLNAVPIRATEAGLEIAMADPSDQKALDQLKAAAGRPLILMVASLSDVKRAVDNSYRALAGIETHVQAFQATETSRRLEQPLQQAVSEDAPVVKVVNLVITQGLRDRASDIHIEPQDDRLRVRYRIDGALHDVLALPAQMGAAFISRIKIMAAMNIVERQRPQDGQIAMEIDGRALDIRVATTPTIWGEKAVLRLLDKSRSLYKLNDLGMSFDVHTAFSKLVRSPFGMVICAGPTGSGKTTTLYATLSEVNDSERNIMTIEDPVEYIFPSINQIQIKEQAGMTFAGGLKSILRQDPDVILVGECRDVETTRIAVQSALTGHFVMTSIHATDSASALHRFLDMGIESFLIASSVIGVVGQRLVRRICSECRVQYWPSAEELAFYEEAGGEFKVDWYQGEGCNFCAHTGFQDRIGVYELLRITEEMKNLIVKDATHDEIRRLAVAQGMKPLRDEAIRLVHDDVTTINEVLRSIYIL